MSTQNEAPQGNVKVQFMTPEAWTWYTGKTSLLTNPEDADKIVVFEPQAYLPREAMHEIYEARGNVVMTLEEIQKIIVPDGDPVKCDGTGKMFQPVCWSQFFEQDLIRLAEDEDFETVLRDIKPFGAFYPKFWDKEMKLLAFSGSPYFVLINRDAGTRRIQLNSKSPLVAAKNCHKGHWGESRHDAQLFLDSKKAEREDQQHMENSVLKAFESSRQDRRQNGNGGGGRHNNNGNNRGQRRSRMFEHAS